MERLIFALSRLGSSALTELLGRSTVDLLDKLDLVRLTPSKLAELLIAKIGVEGLLLNRAYRLRIFRGMSLSEGNKLISLLGGRPTDNPLVELNKYSFRPNSAKTTVLFNYFGCCYFDKRIANIQATTTQVIPQYPLFDHQRVARSEAMQFLQRARNPRVLLHMPTGAGKTRTAMNIIADLLRTSMAGESRVVIWLAHSEELCEQAAEEFRKAWEALGDKSTNLYRHFANNRVQSLDEVTNGLLIAGLNLLYNHSLTHASSFLSLAQRTILVVMDEAHQAIAPTYSHLIEMLCPTGNTPVLGLTATPGRSFLDVGADIRLANFFHRQKVTLKVEGYDNPIEYLQAEGYLAKVHTIRMPYSPDQPITLSTDEAKNIQQGLDIPISVLNRLADDQLRNLLIITSIMREINRRSKIIVFACSVAHAELLSDVLRLKGVKAASVTSHTSQYERELNISKYRDSEDIQVLTNFGVLTTGFDAPSTNVAFICRPTRSVVLYSQMIGRAARGEAARGNKVCRIYTVVDNLPGVRDMSDAFNFWEEIWN